MAWLISQITIELLFSQKLFIRNQTYVIFREIRKIIPGRSGTIFFICPQFDRLFFCPVEQQLLGPLSIKLSTDYNLDINSEKYKELQNNKIEIGWNRRAYKLSFYYREDNQSGGINFKIHNFSFDGLGESFK